MGAGAPKAKIPATETTRTEPEGYIVAICQEVNAFCTTTEIF